ncbi:MAG: hypothetical protein ACW99Q_25540 [Candidatus Kariarchaeaceae archaeon]|jgi:hypothetical protein
MNYDIYKRTKNELLIDGLRKLGGTCHLLELFNYVNRRDIDKYGMNHQEFRGRLLKIDCIHRDGDMLELVE